MAAGNDLARCCASQGEDMLMALRNVLILGFRFATAKRMSKDAPY